MAVRRISTNGARGRHRGSELRARDLRGALELVQRVSETADPDAFASVATRGLRELIPCDIASYNEINLDLGRTVVLVDPDDAQRADAEDAFGRNAREHPIAVHYARHGGGPALRMSDFLADRAFRRTALYAELFLPVDGKYLLSSPLPMPPGLVVGFGLVRGSRDFVDRECELLDLLAPHLAGAYRAALLRSATEALGISIDSADAPLVMLARDGSALHVTDAATEILRRMLAWSPSSTLPTEVSGWLRSGAARALTLVRDGNRLQFVALGTRPAALLVTETAVHPGPEHLRRLGLTRREAEVLALVAEGRTNDAIAALLVISPRTVKKHLEGVYAKLGVSSRAAAVSAALAHA